MYPCPMLHSYYQRCENETPRRALNRMIDRAMLKDTDCSDLEPPILRPRSIHPQYFAPHVDVTRAECAFGRLALPKLRKELRSVNPLIARQAVNTIADLVHNPESATEAIRLRVPDRLADLLLSNDSFIRERVAMIYASIASQSDGGAAIMKNPLIVCNLAKSLSDRLSFIRLRAVEVIEMLARYWKTAEDLCVFGFVDLIVDRITYEKKDILEELPWNSLSLKITKPKITDMPISDDFLDAIHEMVVQLMLIVDFRQDQPSLPTIHRDVKVHAIEIGTMEKLVILLYRKDEDILANCLGCLAILCSEPVGKQKSIDMDLLFVLKPLLEDERRLVHTKAAAVIVFVTITTPGKLRALDLQIMGRLLELSADFHYRELQLLAFKALTNIAEVPKGRSMMLQSHTMFIEDIDTCGDETTERHKAILLETIRWRP